MQAAFLGFAVALGALASLPSGLPAGEASTADPRVLAPLLPGIGARDPRGHPDPDKVPWRAVGRLQAVALDLRILCTGTLVGPSMVLTAAHCVFNPRTRHNFPAGSLHFLIGYDGGRYAGHATGVKIETGPGYVPSRPSETRGSDWAMISLDTRLGSADRVLPMVDELPEIGSTIMLGGYQQDHPLILMADAGCRIVGYSTDASGRLLLRHNCAGTNGDSGAPLLIEKGGKWYVAGIDVTAENGFAGGFAVAVAEPRTRP